MLNPFTPFHPVKIMPALQPAVLLVNDITTLSPKWVTLTLGCHQDFVSLHVPTSPP